MAENTQGWSKRNLQSPNLVDKEWKNNDVNFKTINQNYLVACSYYSAKRDAFLKYWSTQLRQTDTALMEYFLQQASLATETWYKQVTKQWDDIYRSFKDTPLSSEEKYAQTVTKFKILINQDKDFKQLINQSSILTNLFSDKPSNDRNFYQERGFAYEEVLKRNFQSFIKKNISSLMAEVTGGKGLGLSSGSAVVSSKGKATKADVLIYPDQITFTRDKNGNSMFQDDGTAPPQYFEVMTRFNVATNNDNYDLATIMTTYSDYLAGRYAGVGGFSVKTYNFQKRLSKDYAYFAKSKMLQQQLNELFRTANYGIGYLTQDFVDLYTIYHLSKQILSIISPVTVAFESNDGFMWIDDLLKEVYFTMATKTKNSGKLSTRGKQYKNVSKIWRQYMISDDNIRMYSRTRQNISAMERIRKTNKYGVLEGDYTQFMSKWQ